MLGYFSALIKAHRKLALSVFFITLLVFFAVGFLSPKVYEVSTSIYVHKKIPTASTKMDLPDFMMPNLVDHVKIIKSDLVLDFVSKHLAKAFPKLTPLSNGKLKKRLHVVSAKNTKILEVKFQGRDPEYASELVGLTLQGYEHALKKMAKETTEQSLSFLKGQQLEIQAKRRSLSAEIATLQAEVGTTDVLKKNESLLQINQKYVTTLGKLRANISSAQREVAHMQKMLGLTPQQIRGLSRLKEDSSVQSFQHDLGKFRAELSVLKSKYTDKYPKVVALKRTIANIEKELQERVHALAGNTGNAKGVLSDVEQTVAARLLDQQTHLLGLQGQKEHYEASLSDMDSDFAQLVGHNSQIDNLQFELDALKSKENKLTERFQDGSLEQAIMDKLGVFTVITLPGKPGLDDYAFPLRPLELLISGFMASLILSLFAVAISEYASPQVLDLSAMPVLAEVKNYRKAVGVKDIQTVYKNISFYINRDKLRSVALFHLCGASGPGVGLGGESFGFCPYSPAVFARQLAAMFSERHLKTLLVDCSDTFTSDETARETIYRLGEYTLYQYSGMDDLHIVSPNTTGMASFEPNLLKLIPEYETYDVVLLNASLSDNDLTTNLICETADGVVVGVSCSKTTSSLIGQLHKVVRNANVRVLGSILFQ